MITNTNSTLKQIVKPLSELEQLRAELEATKAKLAIAESAPRSLGDVRAALCEASGYIGIYGVQPMRPLSARLASWELFFANIDKIRDQVAEIARLNPDLPKNKKQVEAWHKTHPEIAAIAAQKKAAYAAKQAS